MMKVVKTLFPPGADGVMRWRLSVMGALLALSFLAAWGIGLLPWSSGVAMADSVEVQIQRALVPIQTKISQNTGFLKTLVLSDYAESIRGSLRAHCKTDDPQEKRRLNREIEKKQLEYQSVTKTATQPGLRYPEPDCDHL